MTVTTTKGISGPFYGDGSNVSFPFSDMTAQNTTEIAVVMDGVVVAPSAYSVSISSSGGGTVTFDTAPVDGAEIYLYLNVPFSLLTQFLDGFPYKGSAHNAAHERALLRDQMLNSRMSLLLSDAMLGRESRAGKFLAWDAVGLPVPSVGVGGADDALRTDLAAATGSTLIAWKTGGLGAVVRSLFAKLFDLPPSVKDFGVFGDDVADDTAAIAAAMASGAEELYWPKGTYRTTGILWDSAATVDTMHFGRGSVIKLLAGASRVALDIQRHETNIEGRPEFECTGTNSDGNGTIAVRHGSATVGRAHCRINNLIVRDGFSGYGLVSYQPVFLQLDNARLEVGSSVSGATCYALALLPNAAAGPTTVDLGNIYIAGGRRGFYAENAGWITAKNLIVEYAGRGGANIDGAIHLKNCQVLTVLGGYAEQNERNIVLDDSQTLFLNVSLFAAITSADVVTYTGVAFSDRGNAHLTNRSITIGEVLPDGNVDVSVTTGLHVSANRLGFKGTYILAGQQPFIADAPALTYVAPAGGATVDAEARASLAQLAADVTAIRTTVNADLASARTHGLNASS